jgi:hypothetical protein
MSGQPLELLTGGSGMFAGAGTVTPQNANGAVAGAAGTYPGPHIGVVGLVLFAVLILFALDRAGLRFAVTAGGRR